MNQPNAPIQRNLGRIVLWCLLLALPLSGAFLVTEKRMERIEKEGKINTIKAQEKQYLQQQTQLIQYILEYVKNDALFLSHLSPISDVLKRGTKNTLAEQIFLSMATTYGNYDSLRLMTLSGDEVLRMEYDDGSPRIVPQDELQNKANRCYFFDAMAASPDLIAISPFDLNIERGKVEIPLKPTIRISTPIDDGDSRVGVLAMSFLGEKLLNLMNALRISSRTSLGLLNQDGYWLQGLDPEDSWGFMFPDRMNRNIFKTMPEEAAKIYAQDSGQFQTDLGLISFTTLRPLEHRKSFSSHRLGFWKIISVIPAESINDSLLHVQRHLVLASWIIVPAIFLTTLAISVFFEERRMINQRIYRESLIDKTTGTWNRQYIAKYVAEQISQERTISLALVDLGNFKKVNDLLGHDVGDQVLRQVAEIFQRGIRPQDQVSRHGGDEFLLVFPNTDPTAAEKAMKRLAESVRREVLPNGPVTVEADWGIAQVTEGHSMKEAAVEADRRMYAYKKARKERQGISDR